MQINIDGKSYTVPPEYVERLASEVFSLVEQMYDAHVPDSTKVALMAVTRTMLVKEEMRVRMTQGKEAALALRPPPKSDPTLWLARQYLPHVRETLNHASITCETAADTITNFTVELAGTSETGRQVDIAGGVRVRKNNCA